ncbi:MAG: poly(3-hydroxybutyrate) depolymerase [Pseudomonadota bacterium]
MTHRIRRAIIRTLASAVCLIAATVTAAAQTPAPNPNPSAPNQAEATERAANLSARLKARLPALGARLDQTSTSGISSGAYMAGQFQLAHGDIVVGAAIIAGGPWGCAESAFAPFIFGPWGTALNFNRAAAGCMANLMAMFGVPSAGVAANRARRMAKAGDIAALEATASDRVFLFAGTRDVIVRASIVRAARRFYERIGVAPDAIRFIGEISAGHGFVTETEGGLCGSSATPFVVDCDYDLAGAMLMHIYPGLAPRGRRDQGRFIAFDQTAYTSDPSTAGLSAEGRVFVPDTCRTTPGCKVHIAFHGCQQNRAAVGDLFIARAGLAEWAVTNRMLVLFPQTLASSGNPQGCWDWWGYTGRDFLTRRAPQIAAVRRMLDGLAQPAN